MGIRLVVLIAILLAGGLLFFGWFASKDGDRSADRTVTREVPWPERLSVPQEGRVEQVRVELSSAGEKKIGEIIAAVREFHEVDLVERRTREDEEGPSVIHVTGKDLDIDKLRARIVKAGGGAKSIESFSKDRIYTRVVFTLRWAEEESDMEALNNLFVDLATSHLVHAQIEWIHEPLGRFQVTVTGIRIPADAIRSIFDRSAIIVERIAGPEPYTGAVHFRLSDRFWEPAY